MVNIAVILVALVLAVIAWKVLTGVIKIAAIIGIIVLALWFVSQGGLA
ncbi:hypothetical protein [Novosphingobium aquimarinum]|nr:hypothetical protein [Novosphingobium aquimarinum]